MTLEEHRLFHKRRERIARVKRILRWMPRRANVHRYPVLKWFAVAARKRSYLWSFRIKNVVPAIYAGCILSILPLYGVQLFLAVILAFALRANLPLLATLQFITNPVTALPVYFASFRIGRIVLNMFGISTPQLNIQEMQVLVEAVKAGEFGINIQYLLTIFGMTMLGGLILGIFLATIASTLYQLAAHEVTVSYNRLRTLQMARKKANQEEPSHPE